MYIFCPFNCFFVRQVWSAFHRSMLLCSNGFLSRLYIVVFYLLLRL